MLPLINGKSLLKCKEDDLKVILDNPDFRENEYIDYKLNFSFLEIAKGHERNAKKIDFKNDVCAFANADGGYLIYGIQDKNGCAESLEGVEINGDDTDRYELDRRNDLNGIQPKIPRVQFSFIKLNSGKYVVVLYIKHDSFAPYIYLENEKNYRIYRRVGNGNKAMTYSELRQMFMQSLSLEQSIKKHVNQRIEDYKAISRSFGHKFVHLCFIPETFMDMGYRHNMYVIERKGKADFSSVFSAFNCNTSSIPCVDGVRYIPYTAAHIRAEGYVRNNGIVEACMSLDNVVNDNKDYPNGFLPFGWLFDKIDRIIRQYSQVFKSINTGERVYICLSIVGCRDVVTDDSSFYNDYVGVIDRNEVYCDPIEIIKIEDDEVETVLMKLEVSFLLAIGVKYNKKLKQLIDEVYA